MIFVMPLVKFHPESRTLIRNADPEIYSTSRCNNFSRGKFSLNLIVSMMMISKNYCSFGFDRGSTSMILHRGQSI